MLKEFCDKLMEYINGIRYYNVFQLSNEKMKKYITCIKNKMEECQKNDEVSISKNDQRNIFNSLGLMFDALVMRVLEDEDKEFISNYTLLCNNFGKSFKLQDIIDRSFAIANLIEYQKCMLAQIEISKYQMKHMETYNKFMPPVFDASKSYIANIVGRIEENKSQ
jgi:hypothetical protein